MKNSTLAPHFIFKNLMPIIKSAIKRMHQTKRRTQKNVIVKKGLKETLKKFLGLIAEKKMTEATKLLPEVQKRIDLAVKKNLMHANKAARQKSQFAKMITKTPAKKVAAPATEKKEPAAKKPAAQKKEAEKK
ncbi:30S ribosomal protein S20 [bacterium]|nr:30S ribosomal protein S20 [bacterium]MBT6831639.1 30S ribosomal protein S20 [bacterium]MBT6996285.1 30S ribosomal protein S20 [bacterium]MBT7772963.1 30S ribosomal protein S20 [bacterium]